jgi:hypothetical protein
MKYSSISVQEFSFKLWPCSIHLLSSYQFGLFVFFFNSQVLFNPFWSFSFMFPIFIFHYLLWLFRYYKTSLPYQAILFSHQGFFIQYQAMDQFVLDLSKLLNCFIAIFGLTFGPCKTSFLLNLIDYPHSLLLLFH